MEEMVWKDKDLEALYRKNLEAMRERHRKYPELASPLAKPYTVFTENSQHGIQNMRIRWLMDNHPREFREMMMANVLEEHLQETERRTMHRYGRYMDLLMERRHLVRRTDVMAAHPEITERDRYYGMQQAQHDAMEMAIHEVVESF
ncbi:TnpV protein [Bifidobacterium sp. 64T4]|uniref:TnpV protein n=1 Tax=Bifidobacterium pongonis TaxID=2834432 RepID=UPI001C55B9C7|nr:TnpV protein [Bifidobacterium pongonis]MBW3094986.1 TnpV protein [Bifidobacterium pongonis]